MLFVRIHFKYNANFKYIYKINIIYIKSKKKSEKKYHEITNKKKIKPQQ